MMIWGVFSMARRFISRFLTSRPGGREYETHPKKLGDNDILIIEGIHCLNPKLSEMLSDENKFKVYISALTQLNIDEHNRIPIDRWPADPPPGAGRKNAWGICNENHCHVAFRAQRRGRKYFPPIRRMQM